MFLVILVLSNFSLLLLLGFIVVSFLFPHWAVFPIGAFLFCFFWRLPLPVGVCSLECDSNNDDDDDDEYCVLSIQH